MLIRSCLGCFAALLLLPIAADCDSPTPPNVAIQWTDAMLQGIRDSNLGAPVAARALATVATCMYDSWSAYDGKAVGTELHDALRHPAPERSAANQQEAVSYAAFQALVDVLPADTDSVYRPLMRRLGYDPENHSLDINTPAGIAHVACGAVLEFRHHDGANQLGDRALGAYSDWTGYIARNRPMPVTSARISVSDAAHWQPLAYVNDEGNLETQRFAGAQWCYVAPFALRRGDQFRHLMERFGPASADSQEFLRQARELVDLSAGLTDKEKMIAEYWEDGVHTEQPPGHWLRFAEYVSERDHHTLEDDVKLFFALTNTMLDAGIAAWDTKRAFDSVRPITAIRVLFKSQSIRAWGGPGKGTITMDGERWLPYQPSTRPTPPFPEFVSGHSTYSSAAAQVLLLWTGSDRLEESVTFSPGSSKIEPGVTPARGITLHWATFSDAADEAGMSRRYGGIHFKAADLAGRALGRIVAAQAWAKAQAYFDGTAPAFVQEPTAIGAMASSRP